MVGKGNSCPLYHMYIVLIIVKQHCLMNTVTTLLQLLTAS